MEVDVWYYVFVGEKWDTLFLLAGKITLLELSGTVKR
jgi:hypothetical protein